MFPNGPDTNAIANTIKLFQQGMPTRLLTFCMTMITASASPQAVTPQSMLGITVGITLNVDITNQENVVVTAVTATTFSAIFTKNHGLGGVQWTIGTGNLIYTLVKIGAVVDPTDVTTYCSITFDVGEAKRYASGWRIDERSTFLIESGFDMTDPLSAEQSLMTTRDVLLPIYFAQISLNNTPGIYLTNLNQPDRSAYKLYPNGRIYRVHLLTVQAVGHYNISVAG